MKERTALFRTFFKNKRGGMYVDVIIGIGIMIGIAAMLITLYPVFSASQHMDEAARAIARVAEVSGRVGPEVEDLLENSSIMKPDTVSWDTDYYNAAQKKIQYKTPFEVTVTKKVPVFVIQPFFASEPLSYEITLTRKITGVSEVYWK